MPRQEAVFRLRDDARATAAVAAWCVVGAAVLITAAWQAMFRDPESISWFGLCAGTTLAAAVNLLADVVFHQSRFGRTKDGHGSLAGFVVTLLPPFMPGAILLSDDSLFAMSYLILLFAVTSILAWSVGERDGLLRLGRLLSRLKTARSATASPVSTPQPATLAAPLQVQTAERPSIVHLPQPRSVVARTPPPIDDRKQVKSSQPDPPQDLSRRRVVAPLAEPKVWTPPRSEPKSEPRVEAAPRPSQVLKAHGGHETPAAPKIAQWIKRMQDDAGHERVEGTVQVEFASGQKQATVHIPFVPALASNPRVECHAVDGAQVRLKAGLAQTFGTRIEVRRADAGETALAVVIGFSAAIDDEHSHTA